MQSDNNNKRINEHPQDPNFGEIGKKILIWFIPVLILFGVVRYGYAVFSGDHKSSRTEMTTNGRYTINIGCYGAFTKEDLNELSRHVTNDNPAGAAIQLAKGEIVELEKGTEVILVDYGLTMCKVDVVSGENSGATVYVITEFISR